MGAGAEDRHGAGGGGAAWGILLYAIRYAASSEFGTLYAGIEKPTCGYLILRNSRSTVTCQNDRAQVQQVQLLEI